VKLLKELHAQVWTICGVALVLITLNGITLQRATIAFGVSLALHFAGVVLQKDSEE